MLLACGERHEGKGTICTVVTAILSMRDEEDEAEIYWRREENMEEFSQDSSSVNVDYSEEDSESRGF
jgi:hypothetical protein